MAVPRRRALLALLALLAVACAGQGGGANPSTGSTGAAVTPTQVKPSPPHVMVSGLAMATGGSSEGAPTPLVALSEIRSGGPPPDGIPSIDAPAWSSPADVGFVAANEPVLAVDINDDARAYRVQILVWHEIVNDTVGGVPVAVTYCPLCNSAVAYDRRVDDRVLEFGTSGLLWNSALVMYDRQTETLWSHFTGQGIVGELTGVELATYPVATVPWSLWRDAHPDGLVLDRPPGFGRHYGRNPYPGYDDVNSQPFLFEGKVDGRYTAMTRIVGVELDGDALGVPLASLHNQRVLAASVGGTDLVFVWEPGTASALDATDVVAGNDIGATAVYIFLADGEQLTFTATNDGFVDDQTASTWNLLGEATSGPLAGSRLPAVTHLDTFWFAWAAFQPHSTILAG